MGGVESGKFLGWYFPEENKVPFFITNLNCCYESDRAYDVRRHIGKKHAIVNRNNKSNTLIKDKDECEEYVNRRKPTKFKKTKIIDRGVKENGGDFREADGKTGDGEKYSIIILFQCNFCIFKSKNAWVVRRHVKRKHSII